MEDIKSQISKLNTLFQGLTSDTELDTFRETANQIVSSEPMSLTYSGFKTYMENLSKKNQTVRFWYQFLRTDCFAYIALFIAIRYRSWDLRTGSMKQLAAIFSAFDRPIYQELIPQHLSDISNMPSNIMHHLRKGSFSVRLSPTEWHGVALDECHEMKINKDAKLAVVHPSKHRMEFLSNYMAFRSTCVENLKKTIFPDHDLPSKICQHATSKDKKRDANVNQMFSLIKKKGMLTY